MRPLGRTPGGRGEVNAHLQLHKPPCTPSPCDGWAIRSGGPTGRHILVSLHTPSIVFFLPSLAGDHQTHLTDKLPDYTQSPKMNPVAHVSLELGRTPPKAHALPSSLGTGPLPAHVSTPQGVPVGSGLPQEPVRLWLSHCRLDAPQRGVAAGSRHPSHRGSQACAGQDLRAHRMTSPPNTLRLGVPPLFLHCLPLGLPNT